MNKKTIVTIIVVALTVSFLFIARSCRIGGAYKQAKAEYVELKQITEADHALSLTLIAELNNSIGHRDETIGQLEREVATYVNKTASLTSELAELQRAEPPTTPEIESLQIVVNLRRQVSKLTEMFNLSQNTITTQSREISELRGKAELLENVAAEWKGAYEREHALRVQAESLFKICERGRRLQKFWKTTAIVATGAVTGLLLLK